MNNDAPAVDPQVAVINGRIAANAERQQQLAEQSYAKQSSLADEFMPMFRSQIEQSNKDAATSRDRGDQQWASYTNNFQPLENKMASTALGYDTSGRREQEAQTAVSDVATRFGLARDDRNRNMASMNIDPSSGRAMAMDNAAGIEQAKAEAGGANAARRNVEMTGLNLVDNAAKFGRNMPGTSLQTAALASQQTGQASGQVGGLSSMVAQPGQVASAGLGQASNTYGNANAGYMAQFNSQSQAANQKNSMFGDLLGAGLKAGAMFAIPSSRKLKRVGAKVDGRKASDAVEKSPSKSWAYKPGLGDGNTKDRQGPIAEELHAVAPDVSNGKEIDGIALFGLHHAAIGNQASRLRDIEKKLGLSEAKKARA